MGQSQNTLKTTDVEIAVSACKQSIVKNLDISDSNLSLEDINKLARNLYDPGCRVKSLRLSGNQLSNVGVNRLVAAIVHEACFLTSLDLSSCSIQTVQHLAACLNDEHCCLTELNLFDNNIRDEGAKHLSVALAQENCPLLDLDLGYNEIGNDGAFHLAAVLQCESSHLADLHLDSNKISVEGASYLYVALASRLTPSCLRHLSGVDLRSSHLMSIKSLGKELKWKIASSLKSASNETILDHLRNSSRKAEDKTTSEMQVTKQETKDAAVDENKDREIQEGGKTTRATTKQAEATATAAACDHLTESGHKNISHFLDDIESGSISPRTSQYWKFAKENLES